MAMDKELLLQRLQAQYLTRQEVLYKLPLNISISTFWPELIERRKLNSTVLPLHGADGKPLWYVLTDKMVAASEKLCTLALEQTSVIDPYRATLTRALTEELFFTSFVEGARIELNEAMDFLEHGSDPESVQEQLIHNNHTAWVDMLRSLYFPLDERMVKMLAYRLTDEMDGHATDYRQADDHMIAAMSNETYAVPAASALPTLMQEYYAFMANTEVHPLIKAAVGQAFLLIARPFPDGNERLSRMIPYIVLLRSGYDFFRDISISSMIAKESYRYYKAMQDIIRSENGGDLTYFIEYYLDLLARAVDAKAEQDLRRQQEALKKEREAATVPLSKPAAVRPVMSPDKAEDASPTADDIHQIPSEETGGDVFSGTSSESPPGEPLTPDEYRRLLKRVRSNDMGHTQSKRATRVFNQLMKLAVSGPYRITRQWWEDTLGLSRSQAECDIELMRKLGLICCAGRESQRHLAQYILPIKKSAWSEPPPTDSPQNSLASVFDLSAKKHDVLLKLMEAFPDTGFTVKDAAALTGTKPSTVYYYLDCFRQKEILRMYRPDNGAQLFEFNPEMHSIFRAIAEQGDSVVFIEKQRCEVNPPCDIAIAAG